MRVSIHIAQFSKDNTIERGAQTARAADDAQYICTQLLIAGLDVEVVDGPVSDAPESAYWFVFENELRWHVTSLGAARRDRFVVLRPSSRTPFVVGAEVCAVTYASTSEWSEPSRPGALLVRGVPPSSAPTLVAQVVALLRAGHAAPLAAAQRGPFPIGETLGGGAVRIEEHLQGEGFQKLFRGRDASGETQFLVAFDVRSSRVDIRAFQQTVAYESPGVFPLAFVGKFDFREGIDIAEASETWALAERVSEGAWLPLLLGRFDIHALADPKSRRLPSYDPKTAVLEALALGRTAGRILATAAGRGRRLTRVRPEYMWARRVNGRLEVTGLSARADALFAMSRVDAVREPLYDRHYHATEEHLGDVDDRAVTFALAIIIAEWATGRFPYKHKFHDSGPLSGKHLKLALPKPLEQLLVCGMAVDRAKRPRLIQFVEELERIGP